jgi:hypothetical protein
MDGPAHPLTTPEVIISDGSPVGTVFKVSIFWPAPGPERDAVGADHRLQGPDIQIGFGEVGRPLFFNEEVRREGLCGVERRDQRHHRNALDMYRQRS